MLECTLGNETDVVILQDFKNQNIKQFLDFLKIYIKAVTLCSLNYR